MLHAALSASTARLAGRIGRCRAFPSQTSDASELGVSKHIIEQSTGARNLRGLKDYILVPRPKTRGWQKPWFAESLCAHVVWSAGS